MGRENHFHAITRPEPDKVDRACRSRVGQNFAAITQPHAPLGLGKFGENLSYYPIRFLSGFGPFRAYGLVRTHGPSAVTATQCSKWAE